jgi:nucleotide-binding universal stress UspA family protein
VKSTAGPSKKHASRAAWRTREKSAKKLPLKIHNVLVPVDFSAPSLSAVGFALPLIKQCSAQLHLVHVFGREYPITTLFAMPLVLTEVEIDRSVHRHLRNVAKKYSTELRGENLHALKGRPFEEICRLARDINIDLIVIATRGNTGLKHLVLGSTSERVVRYSPCPVLVVREDRKPSNARFPRQRLSFRKILVPIDFSECSMKGLAYAKALARQFGSTLVLLHAVALQCYMTSDEYARYDIPLLMQQTEKAARDQMQNLIEKTDWNGLEVETSLQAGHPGQQICERSEESDVDLIVTSTHGTTGFKHVLIGSTAEYVVRHAHCPVLVVPSQSRPVGNSTKT